MKNLDKSPEEIAQHILNRKNRLGNVKNYVITIVSDSPQSVNKLVNIMENRLGSENVYFFKDLVDDKNSTGIEEEKVNSEKLIIIYVDYKKWGYFLNSIRPVITADRPPGSITIFINDSNEILRKEAPDLHDFTSHAYVME